MENFHKDSIAKKGISLVEVMVTIVVCSIFVGIISSNYSGLKKISNRFLAQTIFEEQYLIFLLKFEEDYQQAELVTQTDIDNLDNLIFNQDLNMDGDLHDSAEQIAYRWNKKESRIDHKSGNAYFQSFLDGITGFTWIRTGSPPICHDLKIKTVFSSREREVRFCRHGG